MEDIVVWTARPQASGGIPGFQAKVSALKARNPQCRVYLYCNFVYAYRDRGPYHDAILAYLQSQTGVPGLAVAPNDWISQTPKGSQPIIAFNSFHPYLEDNCVPDAQGRKSWAYMFDYTKFNLLDVVTAADGIFVDDFLHRPFIDGIVWQPDNQAVSSGDLAKRAPVRAGQRAGVAHYKNLTDKRVICNIGGWVLEETVNLVPEMAQLQLDGGLLENRFGRPTASYGLDVQGAAIVANGVGSFSLGNSRANHALYADLNFRLRPPEMLFICNGMTAANRAGSGKAAGYRYARYCMGTCWFTTNTYLHLCDRTGGFSYGADAAVISEYDEFFGGDLAGMSVPLKFANRKWMGLPLDPKASAPSQQGCYRRRFENCLGWMNPQGNGTKNLTVEEAGAGKVWRLISGSQDAAVNTGAIVSGTYTLKDQDSIFLKRMDA